MRLLVVEDVEPLAEAIKHGLQKAGFAVDVALDGRRARSIVAARHEDFDLIVLDVMLPGVDGLTLCFEWRQRGITTPILMLTALDATADKVTGLEMGADDYLVKPFAFEELVARIRSLLRRPREALPAELVAGDLTLDPVSRTVHRGDRPIDLTPTEFALLELLMRHPGQVLTRDQIITNVWDNEFDSFSNVLDVHIANLRHKIQSGLDDLIETVRGVGYRIRT